MVLKRTSRESEFPRPVWLCQFIEIRLFGTAGTFPAALSAFTTTRGRAALSPFTTTLAILSALSGETTAALSPLSLSPRRRALRQQLVGG